VISKLIGIDVMDEWMDAMTLDAGRLAVSH
jgi:hypothetical protein